MNGLQPLQQYLAMPQHWNTPLSQEQVAPYQQWQMQNMGIGDILQGSNSDYDYQGAYLSGLQRNLGLGEHFTDQFKKPNHPTFSDQAWNPLGLPAGQWQGDNYIQPNGLIHWGPQQEYYGNTLNSPIRL